MKRWSVLAAVWAVVAIACGGSDGTATETTVTPTATTAATTATTTTVQAPGGEDAGGGEGTAPSTAGPKPGSGSSSEFCGSAAAINDESLDILSISTSPSAIEENITTALEAFDRVVSLAPAEIADDVALLRDTFVTFAELLAEYDYDLLAVATQAADDPRYQAFDDEALAAASNNVAAYCGLDTLGTDDSATTPPVQDFGDALPAGFPAALAPPAVVSLDSFIGGGVQTVTFTTTASFDELVDFYTAAVGAPLAVIDMADGKVAQFVTSEGVSIAVTDGDHAMVVVVVAEV